LNIIAYVNNGSVKGEVAFPTLQNDTKKKRAHTSDVVDIEYAIINDLYDVTYEFNLFKKSLLAIDVDVLCFEVMQVLLAYHLRNMKTTGIYFSKMSIMYKETLEEQTLKANDIFELKHD
jgi:hypothetical protein